MICWAEFALENSESFGFNSYKRSNVFPIDESTLIYASGTCVSFYNTTTKERKLHFVQNFGGVASVAVHPLKQFFAVAEKGEWPRITIMEYPSLKVYRVLRKGTERSYSNISFNKSGQSLASVGSYPDFNICIWNWKQETLVLKAKAFAQEVFRVTYSDFSDSVLTSAGSTHIKFWKIAKTFTGLKLQGQLGKFGKVELSDISGFFTFPDGKVLSGSDAGNLLLWEGNFIKAIIQKAKDFPCHQGNIEVVEIYQGDKIMTAGDDGVIRLWSFATIDGCEGDETQCFFLEPLEEIPIEFEGRKAKIVSVVQDGGRWVISDANGNILEFDVKTKGVKQLLGFNSGKFTSMSLCKSANALSTSGQDGAIRVWNFVKKSQYASARFNGEARSVEWYSYYNDGRDRTICAGFSDGIVRFLWLEPNGELKLLKAMKVHEDPVKFVRFSPNGELLAVISENGNLFFLKVDPRNPGEVYPFCLFETGLKANSLVWHKMSEKVLISAKTGQVKEIKVPEISQCDISQTFLNEKMEERVWTIKMMESQKPQINEEDLILNEDEFVPEDVEWDVASVTSAIYCNDGTDAFYCTAEDEYLGFIYRCEFGVERPVEGIPITAKTVTELSIDSDRHVFLVGFQNGGVEVRPLIEPTRCLHLYSHDQDEGVVKGVVLTKGKEFLISCSEDSTIQCSKIDIESIVDMAKNAKTNVPQANLSFVKDPEGLENYFFEKTLESVKEKIEEAKDILDNKIYSLQQEKLLAEEDRKRTEAEGNKTKMRRQIAQLKQDFMKMLEQERSLEPEARLSEEEWTIDREYKRILEEKVTDLLDETVKEITYDKEYYKTLTEKLRVMMLDELETLPYSVIGIRDPVTVMSLKVKKLSNYMEINLDEINNIVEVEKSREEEEMGDSSPLGFQGKKGAKTAAGNEISAEEQALNKKIQEKIKENKKSNYKLSYLEIIRNEIEPISKLNGMNEKYTREKMKKEQEKRNDQRLEVSQRKPEKVDPENAKEVVLARSNKGDYKLKTDENYEVKDEDRMNVSKQRKYIFELENFIHQSKQAFNTSLSSFRDRKLAIVEKVTRYNKRIAEINEVLAINEVLEQPRCNPVIEDPMHLFNVTQEEVLEGLREKEKEKALKTQGMFGGPVGGAEDSNAQGTGEGAAGTGEGGLKAQSSQPAVRSGGIGSNQSNSGEVKKPGTVVLSDPKDRKNKTINFNTAVEDEVKKIQEIRLTSEKNRMKAEMDKEIKDFDQELQQLWRERVKLEYEMKMAQMKLVTFYQELLIFIEMEERDNEWLTKLEEYKIQMGNLNLQNADLNARFNEKDVLERKLLQDKAEKEKQFYDNVCEGDEAKAKIVYDVYKNHYSRRPDFNDDEQDENDDEKGFDDEEDEIDNIDPEHKALATSVINQPEKLDFMRKLHKVDKELQSVKDEKKNMTADSKKLKNDIEKVQEVLNETKKMLKKFQLQKLAKVNELYIALFLKARQVQNLVNKPGIHPEIDYIVPPTLTDSVLFTEEELIKLTKRSTELANETNKIKEEYIPTSESPLTTLGRNEHHLIVFLFEVPLDVVIVLG